MVTQCMRVLQGIERPGRPGLFFKRKQAEEWVAHQEKLVRGVLGVAQNLAGVDGVQLTERPWRVGWFIHQLSTYVFAFSLSLPLCLIWVCGTDELTPVGWTCRCLQLWEYERTLESALDLGKRLMHIVDLMNDLWDCQGASFLPLGLLDLFVRRGLLTRQRICFSFGFI